MPFNSIKRLVLMAAALLFLLLIWHDPQGTAQGAGDVVHGIGSFFATGIDKFSEFVRALV
jgi:hypothetical protein